MPNATATVPVSQPARRALIDPTSPGAKYRARLDSYLTSAHEEQAALDNPAYRPVVLAWHLGMNAIARRRHQRDLLETPSRRVRIVEVPLEWEVS